VADVGRRVAEDLEHPARGGLLLERFRQGAIALFEVREQAHVLDGDHRLVRERPEQRDLSL